MRRSPKDTLESARRISRRTLVIGGLQAATIATLALRMRFMQVEQADEFRLLAEENSIKIRLLPPARGLILDRNGGVLAGNGQNYRVVVTREDAGDVEDILRRLARLIPMTEDDISRTLKEVMRRSPTLPITVADQLRWEDISRVAVNAPALPGITTEVGLSRLYPQGGDFAHVLGYVGPVSDYDLSKIENPDPLLQIPKFQIGKVGVEGRLEEDLRGKAGTRRIEVTSTGRVMRELDRKEGTPGTTLQLTLDRYLQNYVQARLGDESAAAVVMDVRNGDILSIVSAPTFDPNLFVRGISSADYKALTENDHRPLADKTVQGAYPPGSTFKIVTALAAMEAGVIDAGETVYCPGYTELGNRRFHCWKRGGHGHVALAQSLEQSCDVYYYEVAQRVGIDRIAAMARRLGIGVRHDLPMSAISEGIAPDRAWKLGKYGKEWLIGDTLNAGIGQGYVLASPLQLAVMTARVASGTDVRPRLVRAEDGKPQAAPAPGPLGLSEAALRSVRKGMFDVMNSQRGTAYGSRIVEDSLRMAGKTGTSQVRNITKAERDRGVISNDDLPWERRDHALFVCFAPYDAPEIAVSVVVEHGGGGSAAAAPIARDILLQALYKDLPPLSAYPANQRDRIEAQQKELNLLEREGNQGGAVAGMSYLEYNVKTVPTGIRKVLYVNWPIVLLLTAIASIGFLMLYSVAGGRMETWSEPQMKRFAVGMAGMFAVAFVPIWIWRNLSALAYLVSLLLLVAVELFGAIGMGAQRWIELGPLRLQPSELMKIALVMLLAAYYDWLDVKKVSRPVWVAIPVALILLPTVLVLKQPDLGTAILLLAGGGIVMFAAGVSLWYFGTVIALVIALVFAVFESRGTEWQLIKDYQFKRIDTFLDPGSDPLNAGYNIMQAQIALGSGGWAGKGYMQGTQSRLNFLPEKHTDFIFTTLAEEFGFVGAFSLLMLYALVVIFALVSGLSNKDRFAALLTIGIGSTFFLFFAVNMSMVMGLIPVVGVPLPLVSYGGTAMMILLLAFGLVQSAHIHRPR